MEADFFWGVKKSSARLGNTTELKFLARRADARSSNAHLFYNSATFVSQTPRPPHFGGKSLHFFFVEKVNGA